MSSKPPDADATIQIDSVDGVVELPPESEPPAAPPRASRMMPPPLPTSSMAPAPTASMAPAVPTKPPASVGRLVALAIGAMVLGGVVLAIVMGVVGKRGAATPQLGATASAPASAKAQSVITIPTVEMNEDEQPKK